MKIILNPLLSSQTIIHDCTSKFSNLPPRMRRSTKVTHPVECQNQDHETHLEFEEWCGCGWRGRRGEENGETEEEEEE